MNDTNYNYNNNKSRKEKPIKNSPFVEKFKYRKSSRIQNQNDSSYNDSNNDTNKPSQEPLKMSTPKRENRLSKPPLTEIPQEIVRSPSVLSVNSSFKRYHKNYDPDIEIRQVNERINKRISNSWADQSILNDEEEEDYLKYAEKLRKNHKNIKLENDVDVLARRQNDIDKGKSKQCYKDYVYEVAKECRKPFQPRTPNKFLKMSRRGWDGLVRKWKKHIHAWNEPKFEELYAAGIDLDFCNSDANSIASFRGSLVDGDEYQGSVKEIPSEPEEEETLQGTKSRKRALPANETADNNPEENTVGPLNTHSSSRIMDLHTGLTNDAAALSVSSNKRLRLSQLK